MENPTFRSFKNDLTFGLEKEIEVIDIIKLNFDDEVDIQNTKDIYGDDYYIYDFEAKSGSSWELKARRIKKYQYPTTIVPVSKIRITDKKQFFIFNFTDACCSIEYNKELWDFLENYYENGITGNLKHKKLSKKDMTKSRMICYYN